MDPGPPSVRGHRRPGTSNPAIVPETPAWHVIARSGQTWTFPAAVAAHSIQVTASTWPGGRPGGNGTSAVAALAAAEAAEPGRQVAGRAIARQLRLQLLAERGIPGQRLQPGREIAGGTRLGQPGGQAALGATEASGQCRTAQARPATCPPGSAASAAASAATADLPFPPGRPPGQVLAATWMLRAATAAGNVKPRQT